jgi:hypothetical protein
MVGWGKPLLPEGYEEKPHHSILTLIFFEEISFLQSSDSEPDNCDIAVIQLKDLPMNILEGAAGMEFSIVE